MQIIPIITIEPSIIKSANDVLIFKYFSDIKAMISTPPVEPPPTNVRAHPAPTQTPEKTPQSKILPVSVISSPASLVPVYAISLAKSWINGICKNKNKKIG